MTEPTKTEWAVVDESCHCRRVVRSEALAREILESGTIWPPGDSREPGPLHLERREVSEWERV